MIVLHYAHNTASRDDEKWLSPLVYAYRGGVSKCVICDGGSILWVQFLNEKFPPYIVSWDNHTTGHGLWYTQYCHLGSTTSTWSNTLTKSTKTARATSALCRWCTKSDKACVSGIWKEANVIPMLPKIRYKPFSDRCIEDTTDRVAI